MLSLTEEYAVRSMILIATRPRGQNLLAREIGETLNIPKLYLSKILQNLTRQGLLTSQRGRHGGFVLARSAEQISVLDVLTAVEGGNRFDRCILGYAVCSDKDPCPFHESWQREKKRILDLFHFTRLSELARHADRAALRARRSSGRRTLRPAISLDLRPLTDPE